MNSKVVFAICLTLALLIVLPVHNTASEIATQTASGHSTLTADGSPAPPPGPHGNVLVADGSPAPPPGPHTNVLVADGSPAPPPGPHAYVLVADGSPAPPPGPHPSLISDLTAA
jgi:hypothetical protein